MLTDEGVEASTIVHRVQDRFLGWCAERVERPNRVLTLAHLVGRSAACGTTTVVRRAGFVSGLFENAPLSQLTKSRLQIAIEARRVLRTPREWEDEERSISDPSSCSCSSDVLLDAMTKTTAAGFVSRSRRARLSSPQLSYAAVRVSAPGRSA